MVNAMTEQEQITNWFIHEFWPVYPSKFCRNGKGSRQKALNSMLKHNPDADERQRILGNLKAQVLADKKNPNRCFWSIGLTYVNNQMWEDAIESHDEEVKEDLRRCKCGKDFIIGPKYEVCGKCLEPKTARLKMMSILKEIGVATQGQSLQELSAASRAYLQNKGVSSLVVQTAEKLQMNSTKQELKSLSQNVEEGSGLKAPPPHGSREWFEANGWTNLDHSHNGLVK